MHYVNSQPRTHSVVLGGVDEVRWATADLLPVDVHANLGVATDRALDGADDRPPLVGEVEQGGTHLGLQGRMPHATGGISGRC